ncbi:DUF927 domain-containing protein [Bergeriella denitrificans]|uniref:Putative superfamily II helicase n=1 Tax=Bergeriella denitrificans TaxID=494 RepID=A0A378UK52_BERDE|nr:DUF927 domain-containing protein [Bergeriella denitrificans]STZ76861.1 putative superfamily II helicase [Bergeriella denitrificans]
MTTNHPRELPHDFTVNPAEIDYQPIKPRFDINGKGIFWIGTKADKDGNVEECAPLRLADPIDIIGQGKDSSGQHCRVIQFTDPTTRQSRRAVLPSAEIGTQSGWQRLQSYGLTIHSGRMKRERLADYLQTEGSKARFQITDKAGWHGKAYILPSGEILAPADTDSSNIIYHGDTSTDTAYTVSGSLTDWQHEIAAKAAGNSRLCLAIGTALAAPLLALLNEQNGGFHLYGDSSDGKTTAALAGLSVWGNPAALKMAWRGTDLGFSNAALARNDGLLVLDEIGEAHPKTISKTAYSVINGKSKIQGAKDGGNRAAQEWRVLLLSTGEYSLQAYMERTGEKWEAGQAVRLPSIPAAAALELAADITGLPAGVGMAGVKQCFDDWYAINGAGKYEDRRIIDAAAAFLSRYADTPRFVDWSSQTTNHNHAGYRRPAQDPEANRAGINEYWIIPDVVKVEITQGTDLNKACRVWYDAGWLLRNEADQRWTRKKRGKGSHYVFQGMTPPDNDPDKGEK